MRTIVDETPRVLEGWWRLGSGVRQRDLAEALYPPPPPYVVGQVADAIAREAGYVLPDTQIGEAAA